MTPHLALNRTPGEYASNSFRLKDFGAIAQGVHKFCQFKSGTCEGAAEFLIVWRKEGGRWSITRVLSYGHRPT